MGKPVLGSYRQTDVYTAAFRVVGVAADVGVRRGVAAGSGVAGHPLISAVNGPWARFEPLGYFPPNHREGQEEPDEIRLRHSQ